MRKRRRRTRRQARQPRQPAGESPKYTLLYGSLYMDQMESYEFAELQIDQIVAKASESKPLSEMALIFDIVGTPTQVQSGTAHQVARHILRYTDEHYPGLYVRTVGITDDDERRPMRDVVLTRTLDQAAIDEVHLFVVEDY